MPDNIKKKKYKNKRGCGCQMCKPHKHKHCDYRTKVQKIEDERYSEQIKLFGECDYK